MEKKKIFFLVMRTLSISSPQLSYITHSSVNYVNHVVHYIPSTYL